MKKHFILFILLWVIGFISGAQQPGNGNYYQNPVIPGDFPDPTIIRAGDTYYAAGTTSDFAPHYPLYESKDLVNWKQTGAVFYDTPAWASDSFWAPELYYHNGTFYVFYAAKRKGDRISCIGVATTNDIHEGFTDQGILIEWGNEAIDAFVFRDEDGKFYIFWKAYGLNPGRPIEILGSELDLENLVLTGGHFSVTDYNAGWKGHGDEGQCIFRKDGMYYMLYSNGGCCDNRCDYRVLVARSKNLKYGWEQLPEPILQGGGKWLCTGHGTLVTTPGNRYFYMYHSYNATDFEYIGRQGMLDELVWDKDTGWPKFLNGTYASDKAPVPFKNTIQQREAVYFDDFETGEGVKLWQWDINKKKPESTVRNGNLELTSEDEGYVFTGLSPVTGNFTFGAGLNSASGVQAGVCIYGNSKNSVAFTVRNNNLVLFSIKNGIKELLGEKTVKGSENLMLRIEAENGRYYKFSYSENGVDWISFDTPGKLPFDGSYLPQWGAAVRTGLIFDAADGSPATFSFIRMENRYRR